MSKSETDKMRTVRTTTVTSDLLFTAVAVICTYLYVYSSNVPSRNRDRRNNGYSLRFLFSS